MCFDLLAGSGEVLKLDLHTPEMYSNPADPSEQHSMVTGPQAAVAAKGYLQTVVENKRDLCLAAQCVSN